MWHVGGQTKVHRAVSLFFCIGSILLSTYAKKALLLTPVLSLTAYIFQSKTGSLLFSSLSLSLSERVGWVRPNGKEQERRWGDTSHKQTEHRFGSSVWIPKVLCHPIIICPQQTNNSENKNKQKNISLFLVITVSVKQLVSLSALFLVFPSFQLEGKEHSMLDKLKMTVNF